MKGRVDRGFMWGTCRIMCCIENMCGHGEGMMPKRRGHRGVSKKCAKKVIYGADCTFSFAILGRGIGTGKTETHAMRCAILFEKAIVKLSSIITLETFDWGGKLGFNISRER